MWENEALGARQGGSFPAQGMWFRLACKEDDEEPGASPNRVFFLLPGQGLCRWLWGVLLGAGLS